jgi:hypothetical protein
VSPVSYESHLSFLDRNRYERHLHIKNKTISANKLWRHVLPVRYERHLHIKK